MTLHLTHCWPVVDDPEQCRVHYDLWVARTILSRLERAACVTLNERLRAVTFEWANDEDPQFIYDAFEGAV